jgi:hypothetical protein
MERTKNIDKRALDPKFSLVTAENTVALILLVMLIVLAYFWFLKPQEKKVSTVFCFTKLQA